MLTVLGGLAELERSLIAARTGEGRARAQAGGVRFVGPHKLNHHQRQEVLVRLRAGETQADIARSYAVDATTIGRLRQNCGITTASGKPWHAMQGHRVRHRLGL
jgi:DNA invertase Pin-like site-specific DNA recombinase